MRSTRLKMGSQEPEFGINWINQALTRVKLQTRGGWLLEWENPQSPFLFCAPRLLLARNSIVRLSYVPSRPAGELSTREQS